MQTPEPQPSNGGFRSLMDNRAFVVLWAGQIISQLADKFFFVLLITLVGDYQPPENIENSMRSSVMIANTLPAVFFGSAAGIFVDRWSKKQILWTTTLMRGLLTLVIIVLPKSLPFFPLLLTVAFLESILTQFFAPAEQAAIPVLVKPNNLMPANALFTTTMMGSLVVGFAVGDPLLSWSQNWGGVNGREFLVGGLYVLSAIVLGIMLPLREKKHNEAVALHPFSDLKLGFAYLRKNRLISNAMVQLTMLYCVFAALSVLSIGLAEKVGFEKPSQFGFLLAAAGVGLVIGAGVLGQWGDRFHHLPLPLFGFFSMGIVLVLFSFIHKDWLGIDLSIALSLSLSMFLGMGAAMIGVPMQTLIQVKTPPDMRGKVFGFQNNVVNIALSVPLAIAGILADVLGLRRVLIAMGITVVVAGFLVWRSTRKVLQDVI
ncbi:MFS transporter [Acaryochloris sp. CCMEE 5410]|uniref:MFS transporter n=1 Tax=Acaryochloris sp. CCMEE 5410 TaxID=310037 RepID=UPI000248453D|nr:MFS transporter [Acaryochloris sp. CCMEE 5410]KAI9134853.1 MFS transporter [Acaryochloris sp. CCMEE 5410]